MSESYVECMVARKPSMAVKVLAFLIGAIAVIVGLAAMIIQPLLLFVAAAIGFGAYFININASIEYEYLYIDKEIVVDKIMSQSKRKRVASYEVDKIEIMAPLKSYHLDQFKNRTFKEVDISSGVEGQPEVRYTFYYNGTDKVIFEPNEAMVKAIRNVAPRKVFVD